VSLMEGRAFIRRSEEVGAVALSGQVGLRHGSTVALFTTSSLLLGILATRPASKERTRGGLLRHGSGRWRSKSTVQLVVRVGEDGDLLGGRAGVTVRRRGGGRMGDCLLCGSLGRLGDRSEESRLDRRDVILINVGQSLLISIAIAVGGWPEKTRLEG
jgi:hypothetical protein